MKDLGTLAGRPSRAFRVNSAGQVVGLSSAAHGTQHAFLYYPEGGMRDLGTLGGPISLASDVNNAGQVVGVADAADGGSRAFLYSGGKMVDLNTLVDPAAGWTLLEAIAVNDSGQIAGFGKAPDGGGRAFLLTPHRGGGGPKARDRQGETSRRVGDLQDFHGASWTLPYIHFSRKGSHHVAVPSFLTLGGTYHELRKEIVRLVSFRWRRAIAPSPRERHLPLFHWSETTRPPIAAIRGQIGTRPPPATSGTPRPSGTFTITAGGNSTLTSGHCYPGLHVEQRRRHRNDGHRKCNGQRRRRNERLALRRQGLFRWMYISGGGSVSSGTAYIGSGSFASGTVTVDGPSSWTCADLRLADGWQATLSITGGGTVSASGACLIGTGSGAAGSATVDGAGSTH